MSPHTKIILTAVILFAIVAGLYFAFYFWSMRSVKTPTFSVLKSEQNIQIRRYAPMILAQVEVDGNQSTSVNKGFRLLASYIFGNNIAMTAPVQQQSTKIQMTAPVMQQKEGGSWKVSFVMPAKYTLDTLPKPKDQRVKLITVAAEKYIVIRFSGNWSTTTMDKQLKNLNDYISKNQLKITGKPVYAFYNPPWTLPFMRRTEIMYKLESM